MISWKEASKDPELMIKYKDDLKNEVIFREPWHVVFWEHPHLYREFSDRFNEMNGWAITCALGRDPTLISDLKDYLPKMGSLDITHTLRDTPTLILDFKDYLHKMDWMDMMWLLKVHPKLFLCVKYKDNPDKVEAAYYIGHSHELNNLNKKEKREMGKRIMEILKKEKI